MIFQFVSLRQNALLSQQFWSVEGFWENNDRYSVTNAQ
jgi:hypothetical protein